MEKCTDLRRHLPDDAEIGHWTAIDGWQIRTLRLRPAGPARGAVLFAGGRADFIEKYLESLIHWRDSGWDVTSFDWRGQGGSGRMTSDPLVGHVSDFAVWVNDLAGLTAEWRKNVQGPHILIGHSMGGHLMLRYVAEQAPDVAALVLSSPMIGIRAPLPVGIVRKIAAAKVRQGQARFYAWGQSARAGAPHSLRQRRLTSDAERYSDELWWHARQPELVLRGTSWGWIDAAYRSIAALAAPGVPEGIRLPVLLVASQKDRVVQTARAVELVRRVPCHEIALYNGAHELLRERDDIRRAMWERIDRFMEDQV